MSHHCEHCGSLIRDLPNWLQRYLPLLSDPPKGIPTERKAWDLTTRVRFHAGNVDGVVQGFLLNGFSVGRSHQDIERLEDCLVSLSQVAYEASVVTQRWVRWAWDADQVLWRERRRVEEERWEAEQAEARAAEDRRLRVIEGGQDDREAAA